MADLTDRMHVALIAVADNSDEAPPASGENAWTTPARQAWAYQAADALRKAGLDTPRDGRVRSGTRPASGAANTLVALRNRGLVAGGEGMAWASAQWWITPEGARVLDELAADAAREEAYERWKASGAGGMDDLELRAAAQHAQVVGDDAAERQIDDRLAARGQR